MVPRMIFVQLNMHTLALQNYNFKRIETKFIDILYKKSTCTFATVIFYSTFKNSDTFQHYYIKTKIGSV